MGRLVQGQSKPSLGPGGQQKLSDSVSINPRAIRVKVLDQDEDKRGAKDRDKGRQIRGVGGKKRDE
jgi:hypothetical protein